MRYNILFCFISLATAFASPEVMDRGLDATALVQSRIAALPQEGGTLRLSKGEYHFYENDASPVTLSPSNNQRGEKRVVFPLVGCRNVTVDGGRTPFAACPRPAGHRLSDDAGLARRQVGISG